MKQLKLTTSLPQSFGFSGKSLIEINGEKEIIPLLEVKAKGFYLHGDIEYLAGNDIPIILDGDLNNLNLPIEKQDIVVLLPSGEYKCKSTLQKGLESNVYYITLFNDYESLKED